MKRSLLPVICFAGFLSLPSSNSQAQQAEGLVTPPSNWNYRPGVGLIYGNGDLFSEGLGSAVLDHAGPQPMTYENVPVGDLRLGADRSGPRFGLRMQESFGDPAAAANPATFNWKSEDGKEDWNARGALMVDIYGPADSAFGYDPEHNSIHFTFAAELNKYEEGGKSVDNESFAALLNIQSDFLPHVSANDKYWKQPLSLGGVYTRDNVSGKEQWGLLFRYDPVFHIFQDFAIGARNRFKDDGIADNPLGMNLHVVKNEKGELIRGTDDKGTPTAPVTKNRDLSNAINQPSAGLDIRPVMGLKLADGSELTSVKEVADAYFQYGVNVSLPLYHDRVELGYSVISNTAVSGGGGSHVAQSAYINITPRNRDGKSPVFIRAAYHSGEAAPTFEQHEGWSIGVGIRL